MPVTASGGRRSAARSAAVIGLRSNFGPSLVLVIVVVLLASVAAAISARRAAAKGRSPLVAAARSLAAGAVAATLAATALPHRWGIESDGDLALGLGSGGLSDWQVLVDDPASLPAIQLVANVVLYAAIGFTMTLGWPEHRRWVTPLCVALSVLIETAQFTLLGRVAALDDVVLNGAGAVAGHLAAIALLHQTGRIGASDPIAGHTGRHARGDRRLPPGLSRRL